MSHFNELPWIFHDDAYEPIGQCDCDCDCACASVQPFPRMEIPRHQSSYRKTVEPVVIIPLPDDHYLCLNSNQGIPSVLNETAYTLWSDLERSVSFEDLRKRTGYPQPDLDRLLSGLQRAGLLQLDSNDPGALEDRPSPTLTAWLHVTNKCQLACEYCYVQKSAEHMDLITGIKSLNVLFRQAKLHHYQKIKIKYSGGEPTLNFCLIQELHYIAKEKAELENVQLQEVILSNGVHWTAEMIQFVKQEQISVMLSWDGQGNFHDQHRKTASGGQSAKQVQRTLEEMCAAGIAPHVSITISPQNLEGLPSQVKWLLQKGIRFSLNFYRTGNTPSNDLLFSHPEKVTLALKQAYASVEENLPSYSLFSSLLDRTNLSHTHQHVCSAGRDYLVIDHEGRISKCQMEMSLKLTNLDDPDPLGTLRTSQEGVQNLSVDKKQGCTECMWRYWCGGGCPLEAKTLSGRYDIGSVHCQVYQKLFPELLKLEGIRLIKEHSRGRKV